ncbi:hypothetical protein BDF14DRAFT_230400 [Spinellus fusiger]|nr:hypothetical protein BDF14DRAFT_230400 [Spinellus fusiger]
MYNVSSDENGPFLVSWMSPWQKSILETADEWCIDSTHKTCKSFTCSSADCYLFTIVRSCTCFGTVDELDEIEAIRQVFGNTVETLLCHWHIKRAWEKRLKTDVKIPNSTHESVNSRNHIRILISNLMYAQTIEIFDSAWETFKSECEEQFPIFFTLRKCGLKEKIFGQKPSDQLPLFTPIT